MKSFTALPHTLTFTDVIGELGLGHYFQVLMTSSGVNNPYHNVRHAIHVFMEVFRAIRYFQIEKLDEVRALLIAALLQDLNHPGTKGPDSENIKITLAAIESALLRADRGNVFKMVSDFVRFTEFPHTRRPKDLFCRIMQDADLTQVFSDPYWINEILFGLAREWGTVPNAEHIDGQIDFLRSIQWQTHWAQGRYPKSVIDAKIAELEQWKLILVKVK
jgi:hypothetical protein